MPWKPTCGRADIAQPAALGLPLASVACLLAMLWLGGWWQPGDWLQDWRADYVAAPGQVANGSWPMAPT